MKMYFSDHYLPMCFCSIMKVSTFFKGGMGWSQTFMNNFCCVMHNFKSLIWPVDETTFSHKNAIYQLQHFCRSTRLMAEIKVIRKIIIFILECVNGCLNQRFVLTVAKIIPQESINSANLLSNSIVLPLCGLEEIVSLKL